MVRYTQEQKENALKRVEEIGAKQARAELGISMQTLYKWRAEAKVDAGEDSVKKTAKKKSAKKANKKNDENSIENIRALLTEDDALTAKITRLEAENAALIAMNIKLKKALASFIEA